MFNFFSKNTDSNNIPSEVVNKVVNNTTTYAGIKVSDATYNYFASATKHFADATTAAASCGAYAALTATYAAKTAIQGVLGLCAYKEFAAEVMTGHAFGLVMPEVIKTVVGAAASAIYHHPTAVMTTFVAAVVASPENAAKTVENAACTVMKAAECAYHDVAGIVNVAAGIGHFVYDNLPSYSEMELAGSDSMEVVIPWMGAVA
ncbi:hypothetical protein H6P87_00852 [Rickettsia tillamookensis]|uniref:Uncharacterized protein n=1 Tax=Rickettsia tillamookensis TaxID=2761623 RepID=A0A9E6MIC4_9RICK|nr:hypothetical protein [Rickettsia tillamookensis]QQV75300.1 hypothetical protein H6P87_00852 [Rickettsia tillamookensis]